MPKDFATVRAKGTWTLQKRSELKGLCRENELRLPETLEEEELPVWLENAQLLRTLRYQPGLRDSEAREILTAFSYPLDFKLGKIPHSRRVELAEAIRERV